MEKSQNMLLLQTMICLLFSITLALSPILSLCRQSGWVWKTGWRPPRVCVPLWGFRWEREQVQAKQLCPRQACEIHHQWIHRGITTRSVMLSLIEFRPLCARQSTVRHCQGSQSVRGSSRWEKRNRKRKRKAPLVCHCSSITAVSAYFFPSTSLSDNVLCLSVTKFYN